MGRRKYGFQEIRRILKGMKRIERMGYKYRATERDRGWIPTRTAEREKERDGTGDLSMLFSGSSDDANCILEISTTGGRCELAELDLRRQEDRNTGIEQRQAGWRP